MDTVKVECDSCNGTGYWSEKEYKTGREVKLLCQACNGKGYGTWELYDENADYEEEG